MPTLDTLFSKISRSLVFFIKSLVKRQAYNSIVIFQRVRACRDFNI